MTRIFVIITCMLVSHTSAASEQASFKSFYKESMELNWWLIGGTAIASGGLILASGGAASPIVAGIGTQVGGLMGYSGAVATNVGLYAMGGGISMATGAAVVSAGLVAVGETVVDASVDSTVRTYDYNQLKKNSGNLVTLPLPTNDSGSATFNEAIKLLHLDTEGQFINSNITQSQVLKAISILKQEQKNVQNEDLIKDETLLALLYFISNNYTNAKKHALTAVNMAGEQEIVRTLPAFIYAASALYNQDMEFSYNTERFFKYAVTEEPNNPLIPLMFSIYLERTFLRIHDGSINKSELYSLMSIMKDERIKALRIDNYRVVLKKYLEQLNQMHLIINALAQSESEKIRQSPEAKNIVRDAFARYKWLNHDAQNLMAEYLTFSDESTKIKTAKIFNNIKGKTIKIMNNIKGKSDNLIKSVSDKADSALDYFRDSGNDESEKLLGEPLKISIVQQENSYSPSVSSKLYTELNFFIRKESELGLLVQAL